MIRSSVWISNCGVFFSSTFVICTTLSLVISGVSYSSAEAVDCLNTKAGPVLFRGVTAVDQIEVPSRFPVGYAGSTSAPCAFDWIVAISDYSFVGEDICYASETLVPYLSKKRAVGFPLSGSISEASSGFISFYSSSANSFKFSTISSLDLLLHFSSSSASSPYAARSSFSIFAASSSFYFLSSYSSSYLDLFSTFAASSLSSASVFDLAFYLPSFFIFFA